MVRLENFEALRFGSARDSDGCGAVEATAIGSLVNCEVFVFKIAYESGWVVSVAEDSIE